MNKQELINELAKYIERLENVRSDYEHGRRDAYRVALESAKKLDEPQKPVVPKCFDIDYKKYKYMENNKAEILLTAMGGIYRVSFPNSFRDDLEANAWKTGIKWNKWTKETILWASRNYADFCQAVISGEYEVEKEPLYCVKIGNGYFSGWYETKATYVIDDAPGALAQRVKYGTREEAELDAFQIGGTVEEVVEG